jgi:hypothetical protein
MGAFINSQADQEICDALTRRFSDLPDPNAEAGNPEKTMIGSVRFQDGKEGGLLFGRRHNLARLAHRLGGVPAAQQSKLRWFFLLRRMLPRETKTAISAVLETVMGDSSIKQVKFMVDHSGAITRDFELDPNNSNVPQTQNLASVHDPKTLVKTCVMLLHCKLDEPLPDPDPAVEIDPPAPHNPEVPPIIIA